MNLAVKPPVVAFLASMVLLASVSSAIDPPARASDAGLAIEDLVSAPSDPVSANPARDGGTADPVAAGSEAASDGAVAGATPGATAGPTAAGSDPSATPTEGGTAGPVPSPSPSSGTTPQPQPTPTITYPEAALYDDAEKVRGITDETITLCGHAALALAAAFNTSEADLNVYWQDVNERQGGIYGRDVAMTWEDDAYVADKAVLAAESCLQSNPFMILGGIGFDQIPKVRTWAEDNRELYLHHIAIAPTQPYSYSFSLSPTVEAIGEQFGRYISTRYGDRKVGTIYRQTENWTPGHDAGAAILDERGVPDAGRYPVYQNQGAYGAEINSLALNGAEVVWVWENALNAAQIINQATEQDFRPIWVVFPFQTTIDILQEAETLTIDGVASWPSYAPGGYGGAFPAYDFDGEIARFEAAYAKYRPGVATNDLLWQVWVGSKMLHRMFLDCGPDCNRNRFAGMMLSGYQAWEKPGCPVDFTDPRSFGGHVAGYAYFTQEMYTHTDATQQYRTTSYCQASLG